MIPDPDYLKNLLDAFRSAPEPTTDIQELQNSGLNFNDPKFEFHLKLLVDDRYVECDNGRPDIGLRKGADGYCQWSVVPLRLTAAGHEFAEALDNHNAFETVKTKFLGASISTMKDVAVAMLKSEIARHTGLQF